MPKQTIRLTGCHFCGYEWRTRSKTPVCPKCFPRKANGQDGKRLDVICEKCRHRWDTRCAVEDAICPRCQGPAVLAHKWVMEVKEIPKEPSALWPKENMVVMEMPPQAPERRDSHQRYNRSAVEDYLHGIGCWGADNFGRCLAQRSDQEHAIVLRQVISVNKTRHDPIGEMETAMALEILNRLGL